MALAYSVAQWLVDSARNRPVAELIETIGCHCEALLPDVALSELVGEILSRIPPSFLAGLICGVGGTALVTIVLGCVALFSRSDQTRARPGPPSYQCRG